MLRAKKKQEKKKKNNTHTMPETTLKVEMSCSGCSGACTRILKKIDGVEDVDASLDDQTITVQHTSSVKPEKLLSALEKWAENAGKSVSL